jgi:hypothetical protein
MGMTYKPEDARRRSRKDKALKDLDPSLKEPAEKKLTNRSKKTKGMIKK